MRCEVAALPFRRTLEEFDFGFQPSVKERQRSVGQAAIFVSLVIVVDFFVVARRFDHLASYVRGFPKYFQYSFQNDGAPPKCRV